MHQRRRWRHIHGHCVAIAGGWRNHVTPAAVAAAAPHPRGDGEADDVAEVLRELGGKGEGGVGGFTTEKWFGVEPVLHFRHRSWGCHGVIMAQWLGSVFWPFWGVGGVIQLHPLDFETDFLLCSCVQLPLVMGWDS